MAQDVAEKIRAAAVAKGIDPDTALRIAGVESSYDPKAKNPSSSAKGLFQVIDDTWKRYGGKPGKQRDTDENIRVGMLILEDNTNKLSKILGRAPRPSELYTAHFFGTGTGAQVLRADPDTPINRIASKKVMAANPHLKGLTVGQLMAKHEAKFARTPGTPAYAGKKGGERQDDTQKMMTDSLSSGQTAQAQPTVLDDPRIKALGTNYQMALAATTLADKGDKDDDTTEAERFQQYMEERQEEAIRAQEPEPARKALASFDLGYKSPFAEEAPAQQAPLQMAFGGSVAPPSAGIRPSERKAIESANAQWEKYKQDIESYNKNADAYNAWHKDYDATVNAPRKYSANSKRPSLEKRHARYIAKNPQPTFDPAAQPVAPGVQPQELLAKAQRGASNRHLALTAFFEPNKFNLSFSEGGEVEEPYTPGKVAKMGEDDSKKNLQEFLPPNKMSVQALDNLLISAGLDVSKIGRGQKLDLAKALYAQANGQVGNASLYARMSNESNRPEMLGGMSLPMGNGRASVDVNPGGVNYGYQTRLGSGEIMANFFKPMQGPGQGSVQYRMPLGRAEGGAVYRAEGSPETGERLTPQQIEQIAQRETAGREYRQNMLDATTRGDTYTGLAKGFFQNVVPNVVGIPTDLTTMALRPFGYKVEKPFLGSEYNKEKLTEFGMRPEPPAVGTNERNFYDVGNFASFFVNPASATRKAVAAGEKVVEKGAQAVDTTKKGVKKAKDMLSSMKKPEEVPQTVRVEPAMGAAPAPVELPAPPIRPVEPPPPGQQAEPLPPPPAEVAVPPALLETPPVAPPMQAAAPDVIRPFVGRLDAFVDTIKNPVQLGQLKGQLKGKFRDYDLERVERAFAGMDDKTKLTPDQIKQALAGVHSPSKMISETIPPTPGKHWQNNDNVWDAPLGTTNLYLEQTPEILAANEVFKKALKGFGPFMKKGSDPAADSMENARALLTDPELLKIVDPELISNLSKAFDKVEKNVNLVGEYSGVIKNVSDGFQYPILYKDATVASAKYLNQPFFKFSEEALNAEREALKQKFMAQGKNEQDASFLASGEINANFEVYSKQAQKIASQKVQELAIAEAQKHGINLPDVSLVKWDELEDVTRPMQGRTAIPFNESVVNALEPSRVTVHEAIKNIKNVMDPEIKKVGDALAKKSDLYAGKHTGVAGKTYPISFTRFSEHEATIPGLGTVQGRHFHELQSDLYNAFTKQGSAYGSRAKDQEELAKLQAQIAKNKSDALDQKQAFQAQAKLPGSNISENEYVKAMGEIDKKVQRLNVGLEDRADIVSARINDFEKKVSYKMQEPFANFETSTDVRRQLLIKGAVHSAIKDGKGFATFPGKESTQPQLYVDMDTGRSKVYPNLKQVVKDMGGEKAGFDIREIQLPPDKDGNPVMAWGITWSPETAARILEKGIPFAKGGMVERQSADTRRYL